MRTLKEIDQAYMNECAQIGHKQHIVEKFRSDITKLQNEVYDHKNALFELNREALEVSNGEKARISEEQIPQSEGTAVPS